MVTIGFSPATYSVPEVAGSVSVTLSVHTGTLDRDVLVTLTTMNGTAMCESLKVLRDRYPVVNLLVFLISPAGKQYSPISTDVTFNAGISIQVVIIPIVDNMMVKVSTLFRVVLTSTDSAVVLHPATADVTIEDDDCELRFKQICAAVQQLLTNPFSIQWSQLDSTQQPTQCLKV